MYVQNQAHRDAVGRFRLCTQGLAVVAGDEVQPLAAKDGFHGLPTH